MKRRKRKILGEQLLYNGELLILSKGKERKKGESQVNINC